MKILDINEFMKLDKADRVKMLIEVIKGTVKIKEAHQCQK